MAFIYYFFCNRKKKEEQKPVKLEDEHIDDIFLSPPVKPHPPPKRRIHIINRDTPAEEEVLTTSGTQTQDDVGIQTEKRLIVEHDPVRFYILYIQSSQCIMKYCWKWC
jgi:hypothetical protein